jgi:hypothetical protein
MILMRDDGRKGLERMVSLVECVTAALSLALYRLITERGIES